MIFLALYVICIIQSLTIFLWGVRYQVRIFAPSTIFSLVLLLWLYPQFPSLLESNLVTEIEIEKFIFFWFLCQTAFFTGSLLNINTTKGVCKNLLIYKTCEYQWQIFTGAIFIIGGLNFLLLSRLQAYIYYESMPTGIMTIYIFFADFLSVCFIIYLLSIIVWKKKIYWLLLGISSIFYIERIIIHGKRTILFELLFSVGVILILGAKKHFNLVYFVIGGLLVLMLATSVKEYRTITKQQDRDWSSVAQIDWGKNIYNNIFSEKPELINAIYVIAAFSKKNRHLEYFSPYWNELINRYIPGQLIGKDVKVSLSVDIGDPLWEEFQYTPGTGTSTVGAGEVFRMFGWFGFFVFLFYGYLMRYFYNRANQGSFSYLIIYAKFGAMIPIIVIFGTSFLFVDLILWFFLIKLMDKICLSKINRNYR